MNTFRSLIAVFLLCSLVSCGPALISRAGANIGLEAEGYREKSFTWERYRPSGGSPFTEGRGIVDIGTVELEKR